MSIRKYYLLKIVVDIEILKLLEGENFYHEIW